MTRHLPILALYCLLSLALGCVADSYKYGTGQEFKGSPVYVDQANVVTHGEPNRTVDRLEKVIQSPRRFVNRFLRREVTNPHEETEKRDQSLKFATEYLAVNGLGDVYIDVGCYDPSTQWQRLKSNQSIRPIWKYTGGTLNWIRYSLLPLRAFHNDRYDPYSNTLSLNSANSASAIYEAAQAKEYHQNRRVGIGGYAMLQNVPFVPLMHHANTSNDALTYTEHHLDGMLLDDVHMHSYSMLGTVAVSETLSVVPLPSDAPIVTGPLLRVGGRILGRSTGSQVSRQRQEIPLR
ncbi:MAG: hypothetical protein AAFN77_15440 [Planctomycetota bacterium]